MKKINSLKKKNDLPKLFAHLELIGVGKPVSFEIDQDLKESTEYILYIKQSGLGLPDKDYYFLDGERFVNTRNKYVEYTEKILTLAKIENAASKAKRIMEIEKQIAEHHWSRVENRDMEKTYNKYTIDELNNLTPNFDWAKFMKGIGASAQKTVIIKQPNYLEYFNTLIDEVTIEDWKTYLTFRLYKKFASQLNKEFVNTTFEFYGTTLSGMTVNRPRWKRGVGTVEGALGEVLGKIYVKRHFKPEAKTRMMELVENLRSAFRERIENLEWMGPETKKKALVKLEKFTTKIGYPDKWKD
ncbi:MAG: peptidase M13, partial [Calditrichia bacterium]|nr:peptidase M13 [Calditrichia bacterium]